MTVHHNAKGAPTTRLLMVRRALCEGWSNAREARRSGSKETDPW